ncbi:hypothetical protein DFH09DRAFT_1079429 [Mycena vulgaris]|nr:hypothetical protein DFH09DRAFT_1079429 [Mycena vulgaris]
MLSGPIRRTTPPSGHFAAHSLAVGTLLHPHLRLECLIVNPDIVGVHQRRGRGVARRGNGSVAEHESVIMSVELAHGIVLESSRGLTGIEVKNVKLKSGTGAYRQGLEGINEIGKDEDNGCAQMAITHDEGIALAGVKSDNINFKRDSCNPYRDSCSMDIIIDIEYGMLVPSVSMTFMVSVRLNKSPSKGDGDDSVRGQWTSVVTTSAVEQATGVLTVLIEILVIWGVPYESETLKTERSSDRGGVVPPVSLKNIRDPSTLGTYKTHQQSKSANRPRGEMLE